MKKTAKKIVTLLLSLSLLAAGGVFPEKASADDEEPLSAEEMQAKDTDGTFATARKLYADTPVTDTMDSNENYDDKDYYTFTMPDTGYVTFDLHFDTASSLVLNDHMTIYDAGKKQLAEYDYDTSAIETVKFAPKKGEKYYICVWSYYGFGAGCDYTLTAQLTEDNSYEKEPNDSIKKATSIKKNQTITGIMQKEDDKDYYQYMMKKNGKIRLSFSVDEPADVLDTVYSYDVYLYDKNSKTVKKKQEVTDSCTLSTKKLKKGTYYIRVSLHEWLPETNREYSIRVS